MGFETNVKFIVKYRDKFVKLRWLNTVTLRLLNIVDKIHLHFLQNKEQFIRIIQLVVRSNA